MPILKENYYENSSNPPELRSFGFLDNFNRFWNTNYLIFDIAPHYVLQIWPPKKCLKGYKIISLKVKFDLFYTAESLDTPLACCVSFISIRLKLTVLWSCKIGDKNVEEVKNLLALPGLNNIVENIYEQHTDFTT